jgi:hypothetical protein
VRSAGRLEEEATSRERLRVRLTNRDSSGEQLNPITKDRAHCCADGDGIGGGLRAGIGKDFAERCGGGIGDACGAGRDAIHLLIGQAKGFFADAGNGCSIVVRSDL